MKTESRRKNVTLNPVLPRRLALLFEPAVQSSLLLYLYVFYLVVKLYLSRFDLYVLAKNSLLVTLFELNNKSKSLVLSCCLFQYSTLTSMVLLFINHYVAAGSRLPDHVLSNTNLKGKVAIVTGGYSGIGLETVFQLLKWNCKVVIFGRDKTRATNAIERMKSTKSFDENNLYFIEMDLDNLTSVKNAASSFLNMFDRLDFLINNAGVYVSGLKTTLFKLESQFSANFLGHFYLTKLLLDLIKKSEGRVINVSSVAHFKYNPYTDQIFATNSTTSLNHSTFNSYYGRSKLFAIWLTHALQRRLKAENSKALTVSLAPGVVRTKLVLQVQRAHRYFVPKYINLLTLKRPVDGAATTLHLCATNARDLVPGAYYCDRRLGFVSKYADDYEREEKLWKLGEELVEKLV
ncbi:short-chain dehydrogenase/reductase (SDR family member), putative [Theileria annulata]|uniref:Short-chain dehydrogenase/reductase (SDR family member), putative n=1 Tax=Theileria annulata TaxID=5874 RepID=Q4U979_THEAN|nr:short-chain dehydrogenase/reductase (SDR family member), putative [Theileria annulata]CAI76624.1 short-chain dehydrogenase/reductase (SDR family member), putative [Theileria annulata]|eukprot:XP_953249.1 short-chain dehydrogenase/reductase (SDR family member), putative [Theileria annulata]